jgi:hypothetical protein
MDEQRLREIRERLETLDMQLDNGYPLSVEEVQPIYAAAVALLDALAAREAEVARHLASLNYILNDLRAIEREPPTNTDYDGVHEVSKGARKLLEHVVASLAALAAPPSGDGAGGGEEQ